MEVEWKRVGRMSTKQEKTTKFEKQNNMLIGRTKIQFMKFDAMQNLSFQIQIRSLSAYTRLPSN